ncbi:MAG: nuclear transport factor 2 family protein [Thermoleophilaceae bacterium]
MAGGDNRALIIAAYEALGRGDPSVFLDAYDPDIELYVPEWAAIESGLVRGAGEVNRWFGHNFAQWRDVSYELIEVLELGAAVVVHGRWRGRGKRSGVPLGNEYLQVFSFRASRIIGIVQLAI